MEFRTVSIGDIEGLEEGDDLKELFDKTVPLARRRAKARLELIEIEREISEIWEGSKYMRIPSPSTSNEIVCLMSKGVGFLHIVEGENDG